MCSGVDPVFGNRVFGGDVWFRCGGPTGHSPTLSLAYRRGALLGAGVTVDESTGPRQQGAGDYGLGDVPDEEGNKTVGDAPAQ